MTTPDSLPQLGSGFSGQSKSLGFGGALATEASSTSVAAADFGERDVLADSTNTGIRTAIVRMLFAMGQGWGGFSWEPNDPRSQDLPGKRVKGRQTGRNGGGSGWNGRKF